MSKRPSPKAYFLNVDLDISSTNKLDPLALEMGKRITVLHSGPGPRAKQYYLRLETSKFYRSPDATIHALCNVIESLSSSGRKAWNAAQKEFNVGYELRKSERYSQFSLRTDTLKRIVKVGATLGVTYYRGETSES